MIPVSKFMLDPVGAHEQYKKEIEGLRNKERKLHKETIENLEVEVKELRKHLHEAWDAKGRYLRKYNQSQRCVSKLDKKLNKGDL